MTLLIDTNSKQCRACSKIKPLTEFYKNKTCPGGYAQDCKPCRNKYERVRNGTWYRAAEDSEN
jgi:hypothetical protein